MNILGEGQSEYRIKDELTDHGVFKFKKNIIQSTHGLFRCTWENAN